MTTDLHMIRLQEENDELRRIIKITEVQRDLLIAEMGDLRRSLNDERLRAAQIKERFEGLIDDMSLMEAQIRELSQSTYDSGL